MTSFNDYMKTKGVTHWYKSNRPIKRYEEIGSKRLSNKEFDNLYDKYESIYGSYESQYMAEQNKTIQL